MPAILDALPGFTWWGGFAVTTIMGILGWLFKQTTDNLKKTIERHDDDIEDLKDKDRATNDKINNVNLKILDDIHGLGIKLAEFKRDISK